MRVLKDENKTKYKIPSICFASGGEGELFDIDNNHGICAKIYNTKSASQKYEAKIKYMCKHPPQSLTKEELAWPIHLLYDNGVFVGFVMPKLENGTVLTDLINVRKRDAIVNGYDLLKAMTVAYNYASVVSRLHEANIIIGDMKPVNTYIGQSTGVLSMLDVDSYSVPGYKSGVFSNEYLAPEFQGKKGFSHSEDGDRFVLGIVIFQVLTGMHPFNCLNPLYDPRCNMDITSYNIKTGYSPIVREKYNDAPVGSKEAYQCIPQRIRMMFQQLFIYEEGKYNTKCRPTAKEWVEVLQKSIREYKESEPQVKQSIVVSSSVKNNVKDISLNKSRIKNWFCALFEHDATYYLLSILLGALLMFFLGGYILTALGIVNPAANLLGAIAGAAGGVPVAYFYCNYILYDKVFPSILLLLLLAPMAGCVLILAVTLVAVLLSYWWIVLILLILIILGG